MEAPPEAFYEALLAWYARNAPDLPWRRARDPYRVWLAEVMLQQTQVASVLPYYERFLSAFPSVQALAEAPLERVLKLWEGLGYYSRARNLHRAAQRLVAEHGGVLPHSAEALRKLPGVGRYTAGAIASIAFDQPAAAVDGNVVRVLARCTITPSPFRAARGGGRCGSSPSAWRKLRRAALPPPTRKL